MTGAVLYHGEPSGPSLSVLAALAESGLDIECRAIDLLKGERHTLPGVGDSVALDMAVEGEGPVLLIDGEAMTEAVFLAQYFDEQAGGCGLQPTDPYARWQTRMWCRQATERLAPAAAYLASFAQRPRIEADLANIESEDLRARWQELREGTPSPEAIADSKTKVAQFARRIEDQLSDGREWLMGDFSMADLETYAWLQLVRELEEEALAGTPRCTAWMARVAERPSVQAALARATVEHPERQVAPGPEINRWG